jgi:hypothetical protein
MSVMFAIDHFRRVYCHTPPLRGSRLLPAQLRVILAETAGFMA